MHAKAIGMLAYRKAVWDRAPENDMGDYENIKLRLGNETILAFDFDAADFIQCHRGRIACADQAIPRTITDECRAAEHGSDLRDDRDDHRFRLSRQDGE